MKKFKKALASALAILSTTSIVTVQGIKPTDNPTDMDTVEAPKITIGNQYFDQALSLIGTYYGVKCFRDYINGYSEKLANAQMKALKQLFQILNERKPIIRDEIEKILIESNLTDFDSFLNFLKGIMPNSIASVVVNVTPDDRIVYFAERAKENVKPESTGMIIGVSTNKYCCRLSNCEIIHCEELKKTFKLNSICACDESGFGYYFFNDGENWYEYNENGMTLVDAKYIAVSLMKYTIMCFSYRTI
mgnify:FL=1